MIALASGNLRVLVALVLAFVFAGSLAAFIPNFFGQERMFAKTEDLAHNRLNTADSERLTMWRIGAAQFLQTDHKLFGIGPRNFKSIRLEQLHFPPGFDASPYSLQHSHNLFLNTLVEEGLFGAVMLMAFFAMAARRLFIDWLRERWRDWPWFGALGAIGGPVIAGSFNAPFYQEHAIFAMMLLGVYFRVRQPRTT